MLPPAAALFTENRQTDGNGGEIGYYITYLQPCASPTDAGISHSLIFLAVTLPSSSLRST